MTVEHDRLDRFLFEGRNVRGELVKLLEAKGINFKAKN